MRIVSVFGAARKREATPQQQAKFWGAILLLLFVLRLLLTLSTVFLSFPLSLSLSECRRRRTNFTFAQISFINIPGEGLQIECLIAMKLHSHLSGSICKRHMQQVLSGERGEGRAAGKHLNLEWMCT